MRVAVTGASGHLGRAVTDRLLERTDPADVVLLTRTPDKLDVHRARGAAVKRADFDEPASLVEALHGVERMLLISAEEIGKRVAQHQAAIDAAQQAGVRHVIYTSLPDPRESNPAAAAPDHRATEEALFASGLDWTVLRNNLYAEYQIPNIAQAIASGQLVTSAGDGRTAYVSREDCAAAAAAALTQDGHESKAYDITGPQALAAADLAALAGEAGGAPVQVVAVDDDAAVAGMTGAGVPEPVARLLVSFAIAAREGYLENVTSSVEDLTGIAARPLRDVVLAARAELVQA